MNRIKRMSSRKGWDIEMSATELLLAYADLHDGLVDMVQGGRLREGDIPEDYQWLVLMLERINRIAGGEEQ